MRRHPNRPAPNEQVLVTYNDETKTAEWESARKMHKRLRNSPKRGPKNRRRLWPTLNYTIEKGVGVVFHG